MDHHHPAMQQALAAEHTPPDEAARVQADIEHMQHREQIRDAQALRLQDRYAPRVPGML